MNYFAEMPRGGPSIDCVDPAVARILRDPEPLQRIEYRCRKAPASRFRFAPGQAIQSETLRVIAVMHEERKPRYRHDGLA